MRAGAGGCKAKRLKAVQSARVDAGGNKSVGLMRLRYASCFDVIDERTTFVV